MDKYETLETIHESLVNGQRKQMAQQIDDSDIYDFWAEYNSYLQSLYGVSATHSYFVDAVVSYNRIKNR